MPYMNLDLEDEDSLSERFTRRTAPAMLDIAVVRLPRISNFTDLNSLECVDGVSVRYVKSAAELKQPDMVVLPGTKIPWRTCCGCASAVWRQPSSSWQRREHRSLASAAAIRCWENSSTTRWASNTAAASRGWVCSDSHHLQRKKTRTRSAASPGIWPDGLSRAVPHPVHRL